MSNEELEILGELQYATKNADNFDFGDFHKETIEAAAKIIEKLDNIIKSFETGEMKIGEKYGRRN